MKIDIKTSLSQAIRQKTSGGMPSPGGFTVTLHRDNPHQPWGIRLVGGCDLNKPLVITRVSPPADKYVRAGDVVLQIAGYDARDIRHEDAQELFRLVSNTIRLVIHREGQERLTPVSSRASSVDPMGLPRSKSDKVESSLPITWPPVFDGNDVSAPSPVPAPVSRESSVISPSLKRQENADGRESATDQPYRTTPLVLPGAKVKRDAGVSESYLRHHPNPMFRQAAPNPLLPQDLAMKQKVADDIVQKVEEELPVIVTHKQFNSPLGLYSEQNIADTITAQTGAQSSATPNIPTNTKLSQRKTVLFDPAKSETYKALHNEQSETVQEVAVPVQPKVFAPVKKPPAPVQTYRPQQPHSVPGPHPMNSIGHPEVIQQGYTFKRLMSYVEREGAY